MSASQATPQPAEIPAAVRALAEEPAAQAAVPKGFVRLLDPRYCLFLGPWPSFASLQRLRLDAGEVEATVEEVRAIIRERGHRKPVWWVGESATPADLPERLLELGFRYGKPPDDGPTATAMAMLEAPPPAPANVEVRLVGSFDEFVRGVEIQWEAFGTLEAEREEQRAQFQERWATQDDPANAKTFLAFVDGQAVGAANAVFADAGALLIGGATLPEARGLGAYRALVRARWDEAERRGAPALVVQAGAMSKPILERLGFRPVCEIQILVDEAL